MRKLPLLVALLAAVACDGPATRTQVSEIELLPDLQFGEVSVGKTKTLNATLRNNGSKVVYVERFEISAPFSVDPAIQVPFELGAVESKELPILFAPTEPNAPGTVTSLTLVAVNGSDENPRATIHLVGVGIKPLLVAAPDALDFGEVKVDEVKDLNVTFENRGTEAIEVTDVRLLNTHFQFEVAALKRVFKPGDRAVVRFTYEPKQGRVDDGELLLTTASHVQPQLRIPIKAKALAAVVSLCFGFEGAAQPTCLPRKDVTGPAANAGELDFGAIEPGKSRKATITLANEGNVVAPVLGMLPMQATALDWTAYRKKCGVVPQRADFQFTPAGFTSPLPVAEIDGQPNPDAKQTLEVTYAPHAECSEDIADIAQVSMKVGSTVFTVDFKGAQKVGNIQTSEFYIQAREPLEQSLKVKNIGYGPLQVKAVTLVEGPGETGTCASACATLKTCVGSTRPECLAFSWSVPPQEGGMSIAAGTGPTAPTEESIGIIIFDPTSLGTAPVTACARIESDDPYRPVICGELRGKKL